jgi:hypothetical protein
MGKLARVSAAAVAVLVIACSATAWGDDEPTIQKDSVILGTTRDQGGGRTGYVKPGWLPMISFAVNGPVGGGARLYAEFGYTGSPNWVKFDCRTSETEAGQSLEIDECHAGAAADDKVSTYSGPVNVSIKMRNELAGNDLTLFKGTFKIVKVPHPGTNAEYFVDDDWRLPIGYVSYEKDSGHGDDPFLAVRFWVRGNAPDMEAHLFYKGKDLAKCSRPGNSESEYHPDFYRWGAYNCIFLGVYEKTTEDGYKPNFGVAQNPGDYEVRALVVGHLGRSIKFTVKPDGSFDNGIATANKLGSNRVIVPVQLLGPNQGPWDKTAWKTGAYYGNPLNGFAPTAAVAGQ